MVALITGPGTSAPENAMRYDVAKIVESPVVM
jgi:hypothetical protein